MSARVVRPERLRVLMVTGPLDAGGTEHHVLALAPALVEAGLDVWVAPLARRGRLAEQLAGTGVVLVAPPMEALVSRLRRPWRSVLAAACSFASLWWTMLRRRPDVVDFLLPAAAVIGAPASLLAGVGARVMRRRSLRLYQQRRPGLAKLERLFRGRMTAIVGNSAAVLAELHEEGCEPDRVALIYNGLSAASLAGVSADGKPDERLVIRQRLGVAVDALVILKVANLLPYKGHGDLLQALAGQREHLPAGWVLLCAGADSVGLGVELRELAARLGIAAQVHWLGERDDAAELCRTADIGVLSSHEEGFSNSILEGMAAGLPMVVTNVGGNAEAVEHGVCGLVVPKSDPRALGAAIASLASAPQRRSAMGAAAARRVADHFTLEACVQRYVCLYEVVARGLDGPLQQALDAVGPPLASSPDVRV